MIVRSEALKSTHLVSGFLISPLCLFWLFALLWLVTGSILRAYEWTHLQVDSAQVLREFASLLPLALSAAFMSAMPLILGWYAYRRARRSSDRNLLITFLVIALVVSGFLTIQVRSISDFVFPGPAGVLLFAGLTALELGALGWSPNKPVEPPARRG